MVSTASAADTDTFCWVVAPGSKTYGRAFRPHQRDPRAGGLSDELWWTVPVHRDVLGATRRARGADVLVRRPRLAGHRRRAARGRARQGWTGFLRLHHNELIVGLLLTLLAYALTFDLERRLADRQDRVENLRFVREHAAPGLRRPFGSLDLRGTALRGLELTCAAAEPASNTSGAAASTPGASERAPGQRP